MVRAFRASAPGSEWRRRRFVAPVLTVGVMALGAGCLLLSARIFALRITLTDSSAPAGVYRLVGAPAGRGALVAACLPAAIARAGLGRGYLRQGDCPAGTEPVAKVLGAVPGDTIDIEPGWVAVNRERFPNSKTAAGDSSGRPLTHVLWGARQVEAGEVWLFGFNDSRSWDARYFGPVPATNVRGVLRPVVTW
jgi:conjugative transfer signal peptidase TraF